MILGLVCCAFHDHIIITCRSCRTSHDISWPQSRFQTVVMKVRVFDICAQRMARFHRIVFDGAILQTWFTNVLLTIAYALRTNVALLLA